VQLKTNLNKLPGMTLTPLENIIHFEMITCSPVW